MCWKFFVLCLTLLVSGNEPLAAWAGGRRSGTKTAQTWNKLGVKAGRGGGLAG